MQLRKSRFLLFARGFQLDNGVISPCTPATRHSGWNVHIVVEPTLQVVGDKLKFPCWEVGVWRAFGSLTLVWAQKQLWFHHERSLRDVLNSSTTSFSSLYGMENTIEMWIQCLPSFEIEEKGRADHWLELTLHRPLVRQLQRGLQWISCTILSFVDFGLKSTKILGFWRMVPWIMLAVQLRASCCLGNSSMAVFSYDSHWKMTVKNTENPL